MTGCATVHCVVAVPKVRAGRTIRRQLIFVSVPGGIVVGHREVQLLLGLKSTVQPETTGNREIRDVECKNGIVEYGETPPGSLTVRSNPGLDFERRGKFLEYVSRRLAIVALWHGLHLLQSEWCWLTPIEQLLRRRPEGRRWLPTS